MNKKGFTLVEIIVVLVIIAILAAISLPALTGYISDARDKALLNDVRMVQVAAQSAAVQKVMPKEYKLVIAVQHGILVAMGSGDHAVDEMVVKLLGDQMRKEDWARVIVNSNGQVTEVLYNSSKAKRSITLIDGIYTIGEYAEIGPEEGWS